jgi:hypothetical protein
MSLDIAGRHRESRTIEMERSPVDDDQTPPRAGAAKALEDESRSELYWRARAMRIPHAVSMSRDELIAAIEAASNGGRPALSVPDEVTDREVVARDTGALGETHIGWVDRKTQSALTPGELRPQDQPRMVLYERARRLGIAHTVSMSREELIAAIEAGSGQALANKEESRSALENGTAPPAQRPDTGNGVAPRSPTPSSTQRPERSPPSASVPRDPPSQRTSVKALQPETAAGDAVDGPEARGTEPGAITLADRTPPKDDRPKTVGVWSAMRKERFLLIVLVVLTALVVGLGGAWVTGALAHQRSVLRVELALSLALWVVAVLMLVLGVRRTRRFARTAP